MPIRIRFLMGSLAVLTSQVLVGAAWAACVGSTCSLGGQLRAQIGHAPPMPISMAPAGTGDLRWGQPGLIAATPSATIQQGPAGSGSPATDPRSLMIIKPGVFTYDGPLVSVPMIKDNIKVFAIQSNIDFASPHPGTNGTGGSALSGPFSTQTLEAGGRTGPAIVSWCAGLPAPTASYNPGCTRPDQFPSPTTTTEGATNVTYPRTNGLIRYTATKNQFGAAGRMRSVGTAMMFFNAGGLGLADLPCNTATNPACLVAISTFNAPTQGVIGAAFVKKLKVPAFTTATGVFAASIGASGTVYTVGAAIKDSMSNPIPFTGQNATSWGFPGTTGRLTISVTSFCDGACPPPRTFTRTGGDNRTPGGEGIVVLVGGAVSSRSISGPNGNRSWATYNVPEPSAALTALAGGLALLGCHRLVRRGPR